MAEDRTDIDEPDRGRIAGPDSAEIEHFARRHGLTPDEVREMIDRVGADREALEREAMKLHPN